ncbi:AsnC family protein [Amycolatopsis endophytica]|uniref:AsnC family protein n=1 Tax=Amycolatopsis endophytica TaxID=860233 RepID=UPI0028AEDA6D|nr:AsnC family protein [Amycolatopsis endophytica]
MNSPGGGTAAGGPGGYPGPGTPPGGPGAGYPVQSGPYSVPGSSAPQPGQGMPPGPFAGPSAGPQASQPAQPGLYAGPAVAQPGQGVPSGPYAVPGAGSSASAPGQVPSGPYGVPSGPYSAPGASASGQVAALDPVISTWGPPQTASWARGDQRPAPPPGPRTGKIGDSLASQGLEGEQLAVQLLEVQDPADFLFGAAGYRLEPGERAVVVHTEVTNKGPIPFVSLPDNYLELITVDGNPIAKAPVSLTSRPPHKIGVQPGETAGGHTVYVLPESTRVVSVRWSPRPEPDERSLTWSLDD